MTRDVRKGYDYRAGYLSKDPSIFGYYVCSICGRLVRREEMHVDHIKPLARNGKNRWLNVVAACSTCNINKGSDFSLHYCIKGITCKILECIIFVVKSITRYTFYVFYYLMRILIIFLMLPLRSKIHWIFKVAYITLLLKLGGV